MRACFLYSAALFCSGLSAACTEREPAPQPLDERVTHLLRTPGFEALEGIVRNLWTEVVFEDVELAGDELAAGLYRLPLPAPVQVESLRLRSTTDTALVRHQAPAALLKEQGFAYLPKVRRVLASRWRAEGELWQAARLTDTFEPAHLRFARAEDAVGLTAPIFQRKLVVRCAVRGTGSIELHVDGLAVARRELTGTGWQLLAFPVEVEPGVHHLRWRPVGETPGIDLAWVEWQSSETPSLIVRCADGPAFRASFRALPDAAATRGLQAQARAMGRRLTEELSLPSENEEIARSVTRMAVGGDRRVGLWLPATSSVSRRVTLERGDRLRYAVGLSEDPPPEPDRAPLHILSAPTEYSVRFRVLWTPLGGEPLLLDEVVLDDTQQGWCEREVVLTAAHLGTRPQDGRLRFETSAKEARPAGFAEPRIVHAAGGAHPRLAAPNLIVYVIDTLRADHLSCYGARNPTSPHIDALARDGVLFERFYAVAPWTRPTTATLLTGYHPTWHEMGKDLPLDPELRTLAESMRRAGYSTWAAVANPQVGSVALHFEQGFDRFVDSNGIGRTLEHPRTQASSRRIQATLASWLADHGDEPFFLYLHSLDPHMPYAPPAVAESPFGREYKGPWRGRDLSISSLLEHAAELSPADLRYIEDVYDNEIHYQDAQIGALQRSLSELGLLENTVIVVLSDHGEEFYEHGNLEHGYRMWEELLHVPFILWIPGAWRARWGVQPTRIESPISQLDFLPGLLDLLGIDDDFPRQGQSWRPLLQGRPLASVPFYAHDFHAWEGDEIGAFQRGSQKLIWTHTEGEAEQVTLFDLEVDPGEHNDLAPARPELVELLQRERRRWTERWSRPTSDLPTVELDARAAAELEALGYGGDD